MIVVERTNLASSAGSLTLAHWIRATAPELPDRLTHLKLQKLAYYCYGALLAFGCEDEIGPIEFQAWTHGPVSPEIYRTYREYERNPIDRAAKPTIAPSAESHLCDVMNVFGRMTAWQLREESHLEKTPWRNTYDGSLNQTIGEDLLRGHFREMFTGPIVRFPERLFGSSSLELDRIPVPKFSTLHEMSNAASRIFGEM
jgi:uncharacterized phage-associated protein